MSTAEWKKQNTTQFNVRFTNSSGVPQALADMTEQTGKPPVQYIKESVVQALQWDGFDPENHKPDKK